MNRSKRNREGRRRQSIVDKGREKSARRHLFNVPGAGGPEVKGGRQVTTTPEMRKELRDLARKERKETREFLHDYRADKETVRRGERQALTFKIRQAKKQPNASQWLRTIRLHVSEEMRDAWSEELAKRQAERNPGYPASKYLTEFNHAKVRRSRHHS